MKWFDNWFAKKSKEAWEKSNTPTTNEMPRHLVRAIDRDYERTEPSIRSNGMNISVYNAVGGYVVEVRDLRPHEPHMSENRLHVIPSDKDLGESIGHILTYETLKR